MGLTETEQTRMDELEAEAEHVRLTIQKQKLDLHLLKDSIEANEQYLRDLNKEYAPLLRRWEP